MSDSAKPNIFTKLGKFFIDVRSELKRVIWPTWHAVVRNTLTVLTLCLLFGIVIWAFDFLFAGITGAIYGK